MTKKQPSPYVWSSEHPTRAGFYWFEDAEDGDCERIVEIYRDPDDLTDDLSVRFGDDPDNSNFLLNLRGRFAGPIRHPREPDAAQGLDDLGDPRCA